MHFYHQSTRILDGLNFYINISSKALLGVIDKEDSPPVSPSLSRTIGIFPLMYYFLQVLQYNTLDFGGNSRGIYYDLIGLWSPCFGALCYFVYSVTLLHASYIGGFNSVGCIFFHPIAPLLLMVSFPILNLHLNCASWESLKLPCGVYNVSLVILRLFRSSVKSFRLVGWSVCGHHISGLVMRFRAFVRFYSQNLDVLLQRILDGLSQFRLPLSLTNCFPLYLISSSYIKEEILR